MPPLTPQQMPQPTQMWFIAVVLMPCWCRWCWWYWWCRIDAAISTIAESPTAHTQHPPAGDGIVHWCLLMPSLVSQPPLHHQITPHNTTLIQLHKPINPSHRCVCVIASVPSVCVVSDCPVLSVFLLCCCICVHMIHIPFLLCTHQTKRSLCSVHVLKPIEASGTPSDWSWRCSWNVMGKSCDMFRCCGGKEERVGSCIANLDDVS